MEVYKIIQSGFSKVRLFLIMAFCLFFIDNVWSWELFSKKPLVVYFSNLGNTRLIAEDIQKRLDADIIRLETVVKYPKDRTRLAAQMKAEVGANYFPALVNGYVDLSPYDVILVGTPVWNGRAAPAVISFLLKNDFSGKTVHFFSIYSGEAGIAIDEMKKACRNATCGSSLKIELKAPLDDGVSVIVPSDIVEKWTAEIMAKQK